MADDSGVKLQRLQKKLKKLESSGADEERIGKLQRKIAKLQKVAQGATASTAEEQGLVGKKRPAADSSAEADEVVQEETPKKQKKQKQVAGGEVTPVKSNGQVAQQQLASVGSADLARSGKPIVKMLYQEHPEVAALSEAQVQKLHNERCVVVEGTGIKPLLKFEHTGCPANMLHATRDFVQPSPIQSQVWPIIMSAHDLIGIAATGSGKTLAFGLPALRHITAQKEAGVVSGKGPFAVVMAPTRELAVQIADVLYDAGSKCGIKTVCIYGGVPKKDQVAALRAGVDIVVGTPGRLEDLMQEGSCKLQSVTYLVLDEADRMLDLGFEPHIRAICSTIRSDRQTLMFSATWPSAVQKLAANFLAPRPIKVTIGSQDLAASHSITQVVEVLELHARNDRLLELLKRHHSSRTNRIIIFVLYKREAPQVEQLLLRKGWKCVAIHGDISQPQRTAAVEQFKSGKVPLLIATDVAARGLDIPDVEVVINYSFPLTTEDYVHRIGRTGRAGKKGHAHTFFCASMDKARAGELINVLREAGQEVPGELLKFGTAVKKKESKMYGAHFKDVDINAKASKVTFDSDDE